MLMISRYTFCLSAVFDFRVPASFVRIQVRQLLFEKDDRGTASFVRIQVRQLLFENDDGWKDSSSEIVFRGGQALPT
jgi:hypothetical protein